LKATGFSREERGVERRKFARIKVSLQLKFKSLESLDGILEGLATDLSAMGVFLRTEVVKPVGTRLEMEVPIPDGKPVTVFGTVRSIRYRQGEPEGMGIEFDELCDPALGVIHWMTTQHGSAARTASQVKIKK
jgi:hypothetical protein